QRTACARSDHPSFESAGDALDGGCPRCGATTARRLSPPLSCFISVVLGPTRDTTAEGTIHARAGARTPGRPRQYEFADDPRPRGRADAGATAAVRVRGRSTPARARGSCRRWRALLGSPLVRFEKTFRLPDGDLNPELQLAFIAGALVPGWSPTLDALSVSWGNQHGEYWVASCYLPDDTSVELRVDRATLQASLTVDSNPALKPLRGPPAWFNKFLLGALALGVAVGIATSSAGWGIAAAILPIAAQ